MAKKSDEYKGDYKWRVGADGNRYNFNVTDSAPRKASAATKKSAPSAKTNSAPAPEPKKPAVSAPAPEPKKPAVSDLSGGAGLRKSPSETIASTPSGSKKVGSYGGSIGAFGRGAANMLGGDYVAAAGDYAVKKLLGRDTTYKKELDQEREKTEAALSKDTAPYVSGAAGMTALLAGKAYKAGVAGRPSASGAASPKALPAPQKALPAPQKALPAPQKRLPGPRPSGTSGNKAYPSLWDKTMGGPSRFKGGGSVRGDGVCRVKTKGRTL
jgi:hypothetical protein